MTARRPGGLRTAVSLFTVLPVAGPTHVDRVLAGRALRWLPVVGVLLGCAGAAVSSAVTAVVDAPTGTVLGAVLAVATVAALTGGLHLDGLADTADGLGSRRPAVEALAVMRRSDIGPMGVVTLVLAVLVQVAALATLRSGVTTVAAFVTATVVARVAVVVCAGGVGAREDGFGALVAGSVGRLARYGQAGLVLTLAATPAALGAPYLAARLVTASVAGLLAGHLVYRYAARRLGGATGDVYGAVIEAATTTVLLTLALTG